MSYKPHTPNVPSGILYYGDPAGEAGRDAEADPGREGETVETRGNDQEPTAGQTETGEKRDGKIRRRRQMTSFSMNQVRSEKALLEKQEEMLKLREEQLVQVNERIFTLQGSYLCFRSINVKKDSERKQ